MNARYAGTTDQFEAGLDKGASNYIPLTPTSFLARAARVYPSSPAVIYGDTRFSYTQLYGRSRRLASALAARGVSPGDVVAVMAPNVPAMLEAHYGSPMVGAVVNPLNIRLDPETIAFILDHGEATVLLTDTEFAPTIKRALAMCARRPDVIDIDDPLGPGGERLGEVTYEELLAQGDPESAWSPPKDEWQALALSYTSGTTGDPKGVVYHHRGAYINALANIAMWPLPHHPVYLWTLPIFHSLGWCFPWSVLVQAGTHVCLRRMEPKAVYAAIAEHGVTHMCGAPILLNMLINAPETDRVPFDQVVRIFVGGASPPPAVIEQIEALGFDVTHGYGMTELFGAAVVCAWQPEWDGLSERRKAELKGRQGVLYPTVEDLRVADSETLEPVPSDGETMGEVLVRSNTVMKGYLKNPRATREIFAGGWLHTGDLAVMHPEGYLEIRDRSKDIIISGGENISSIEVEQVLYRHPHIVEAAVVARPDEKWGETPCAFVTVHHGAKLTEDEVIAWCRANLAHYKCPTTVVFSDLPKTSTGKVQKFALREQARALE